MRAVRRKDFLRLGGAGLIGAMLLGAAGCNRSHGKVVRFLTGTRETAALERAVTEIHVDRFEKQHPNIDLQREALQPDEVLAGGLGEMMTRGLGGNIQNRLTWVSHSAHRGRR